MTIAPDKDLRIIVTVKNAVMLRAMEHAGFKTALALSKASFVGQSVVGDYLNLKIAPYLANGGLRPSIERIAVALRCMPEDLFPERFLRQSLATNRVSRDISADALPMIMGHSVAALSFDPEESAIVNEAVASLEGALATIPPRIRMAIEMHYGLNGNKAMTLADVGKHLGVSVERARQIIKKGERMLKHPSRHVLDRCGVLLEGDSA